MTTVPSPLEEIRVLEIGSSVGGAFAAKMLAAFGARVTKVEPPGGDPMRQLGPFAHEAIGPESSLLFIYLNTGKHSVTLDPRSATGRQLLARLLADADIVIDSSTPNLAAIGLPFEHIEAINSEVIVASLSPFGADGPYCDYVDSELVLLALGGLLHMVGDADAAPLRLGGYQSQYLTGIAALAGVMTALYAREHGGGAQRLDLVTQEVVAFTEWKGPAYYQVDRKLRHRGGAGSYWMVLRCSDGFIGLVYHDKEWPMVKELIGDPALEDERFATRNGRVEHREQLRQLIESTTIRRKKLDLYNGGQALGIPLGVVANTADLLSSPQYEYRHFFHELDHPQTGMVAFPGIPVLLNSHRPATTRAPLLGEHNQAVYCGDLGLDDVDLPRLHERGVI